jgi:sugar lactone lactonase YvrE
MCHLLVLNIALAMLGADEILFKAEALPVAGFTGSIEGPACDAKGNLYAVAFQERDNIGRVTPAGEADVFLTLPNKSFGNGIVFGRGNVMFVADYTNHNVLKVELPSKAVSVFAHEPTMNQPNDLAIAPDGTLYASDPAWAKGTGQVWKVDTKGKVTLFAPDMGTTNGIEVSPDGKTLYVNESVQRNIWTFDLTADKPEKKLFKQFRDHGFDGMRCDVDGNLYVTRHGKGTVVKLSPTGEELQEIDVLGKSPTNLCFGGADGKTVFVTEADQKRLVKFRVDRPGVSWQRFQEWAEK